MRFLLTLLLVFLGSQADALELVSSHDAREFIVIVNAEGPLLNADSELIEKVYLGEKRFSKGVVFQPVNRTEGPLKDAFLRAYLNMSSREYRKHWIRKVFQEGLDIPISTGSNDRIIKLVSEQKGAIGYLPASLFERVKETAGIRVISP